MDVVKNYRQYESQLQRNRFQTTLAERLELDSGTSDQISEIFSDYYTARSEIKVETDKDASREDRYKAYNKAHQALRDDRNEKVKTLLASDEQYKKSEDVISSYNRGRGRDRGSRRR